MMRTIWFPNWNFRVFHVNGKHLGMLLHALHASEILLHVQDLISADWGMELVVA